MVVSGEMKETRTYCMRGRVISTAVSVSFIFREDESSCTHETSPADASTQRGGRRGIANRGCLNPINVRRAYPPRNDRIGSNVWKRKRYLNRQRRMPPIRNGR